MPTRRPPSPHLQLLASLFLFALLAACGAPAAPDPPAEPEPEPDVIAEGVLLEGEDDDPALNHTFDLDVPMDISEDEVSVDPNLEFEGRVLRTEIEIFFDESVTVGEVNALLTNIDGRIVSMVEGVTSYVVRIPDPETIEALDALIAQIQTHPKVIGVLKSLIAEHDAVELQELPPGLSSTARVEHHLAVRGHAAWNVRGALPGVGGRPWLVIGDLFGDGPPNADYNTGMIDGDFATGNPNRHGYHVLGIIAGAFGASGDHAGRNDVTGLFPEQLRTRAVDVRQGAFSTWPRITNGLLQRMGAIVAQDANARVVVNTSLNSRSLSDNNRRLQAILWAIKVRTRGLEPRVIHLTSAGNVPNGQTWPARDNSVFSYAALGELTFTWFGGSFTLDNLSNTLVVENRVNTAETATARPQPGCAHASSQMEGTISAIGTNVWSFGRCTATDAFGRCIASDSREAVALTGTSMATPQVAGLAAYVWALEPSLSAQEVLALLLATARELPLTQTAGFACRPEVPQPVIDAYDAVLAAGGERTRRALLDISGDGRFDHADIAAFLTAFDTFEGALNYSRFDLNGSGQTGGTATERFDLTMDGSYGIVTQDIEGQPVSFDESALRDIEILCYYAYSPLYQGDPGRRWQLLQGRCGVGTNPNAPIAVDDRVTVMPWLSAVTLDVLANDEDPLGGPLQIVSATEPSHGTVTLLADQRIRYTAASGFRGEDHFSYQVRNEAGYLDTATVTVNVARFLRPELLDDPPGSIEVELPRVNLGRYVVLNTRNQEGHQRAHLVPRDGHFDEFVDLGTLTGNESVATDINDHLEIVGVSTTAAGNSRAFLWTAADGMRDLGTLGGANSTATGVNRHSHVVGIAEPDGPGFRAVLWRDGQLVDIGTDLEGNSVAMGISDDGWVAGYAVATGTVVVRAPAVPRAFLWREGEIVDLGTLGGEASMAFGVTTQGRAVGISQLEDGSAQAFIWEDGEMRALGTLGGETSTARAINVHGQIAGDATLADGTSRGFIWDGDEMVDANEFLPAVQWVVTTITGINDRGDLVGMTRDAEGRARAVLLVPDH